MNIVALKISKTRSLGGEIANRTVDWQCQQVKRNRQNQSISESNRKSSETNENGKARRNFSKVTFCFNRPNIGDLQFATALIEQCSMNSDTVTVYTLKR